VVAVDEYEVERPELAHRLDERQWLSPRNRCVSCPIFAISAMRARNGPSASSTQSSAFGMSMQTILALALAQRAIR
jgi:hypothetical protein